MELRHDLTLRQAQTLAMNLELQNSLKILALNRLELGELVNEELQSNPCLESLAAREGLDAPREARGDDAPLGVDTPEGVEALLGTLSRLSRNSPERSERTQASDPDLPQWEPSTASFPERLWDSLQEQFRWMRVTPGERDLLDLLADHLDERGFLEPTLLELAEATGAHGDDLLYALELLQGCEPPGVGARHLQECLLIQLRRAQEGGKVIHPLCVILVKDHWDKVQKAEWTKLAKLLKVPEERIRDAMKNLRQNTDPRPARQYGDVDNAIVIPDVFVFKRDGKWMASVNEDGLPRIRISKKYEEALAWLQKQPRKGKTSEQSQAQSYLKENIRSAESIRRALQERNQTILKVAEVIIEKQRAFFEGGASFLRPMVLKDIAHELGYHESTISRSTSKKFMHCPMGIFELKYFFSAGIAQEDGQVFSNEVVKVWLSGCIASENPQSPLSDQELAERLHKEKGIEVARRTIAKYRDQLGILTSSKRKKALGG